jgi:hypothetical protein
VQYKPSYRLRYEVPGGGAELAWAFGRGARLPEPLDARAVPWVAAGPDDVVDGERERRAQREERLGVAVDELLDARACRLRGEHVLERVVIGARLEPDAVAVLAPEPG